MELLEADHDREAQYRWHIPQPEMVVRVASGRGEQFGCSERLDACRWSRRRGMDAGGGGAELLVRHRRRGSACAVRRPHGECASASG
jgi:hypothetical protein